MRIKYNILWVENEKDWLETTLDFVKETIEEYGFKLIHTHVSSENEIEDLLKEEEVFKDYDLILVDFQLDRGDRGNRIIEKIRNHQVFTEVIFYSQDLASVRKAVSENSLDGVYCASRNREDFEGKFEKVFATTIKKIQDISSIRGLVISEACDLDNKVSSLIEYFFVNHPEIQQIPIREYIIKDIVGNLEENGRKLLVKLKALSNEELIKHRFFDAYKKMRILGRILEMLDNIDLLDKDTFNSRYNKEIIEVRNELAHCVEKDENGKKVLITNSGEKKIFSDAEINLMRKNLIEHENHLMQIEAIL
jgi:CheY-like chemotaxis protein